ncbi:hypothetical protein C8Q80DRAFT_430990 [Daedaleopsis nitida]|nr:hypothetical protein C8Q80DRAFT_430990 [Daedaleopsis nitida]
MSSLHRFLANADVLNDVFDVFSLDYSDPTTFNTIQYHDPELPVKKQTLARAARTCKAFMGPASRNLWSALHSGLSPLVRMFSNVRPCVRQRTTWDGMVFKDTYYEFDGDVSETEWIRFEQLAAHVRYLAHDALPLGSTVIEAIISRDASRRVPLFANLRMLSWRYSNGDELQQRLLRVLCTPSSSFLWYLPNKQRKRDHDQTSDLSIVADAAPGLLHLHIELPDVPVGPLSPLRRLTSLRAIRFLGQLTDELSVDLGTLPLLEAIHCRGACSAPSSPSTSIRTVSCPSSPSSADRSITGTYDLRFMDEFPALRKLELTKAASPSDVLPLLARIASPCFTTLSLSLRITCPDEVSPFIHTLCALPATQALTHLNLTLDCSSDYGLPRLPLFALYVEVHTGEDLVIEFADFVSALGTLRHVESFRVRLLSAAPAWKLSVADADVRQLTRAWPRLKHLDVPAHTKISTPTSTPATNPTSLSMFASSKDVQPHDHDKESLLIYRPSLRAVEDVVDVALIADDHSRCVGVDRVLACSVETEVVCLKPSA